MKRSLALLVGLAGLVAPVVAAAPRPQRRRPQGVATIEDAVEACRASGLEGWDLVDHATALVHAKYSHYSCYHWWETPRQSFERSRGQSNQYNTALARVLRALGFHVRTVHAARVRLSRAPWWQAGHTWLQVQVDGRVRDVCASREGNRAGAVKFVPVTMVRPFRGLTYVDTTVGLAPIALLTTWRAWLRREPLPRWMYRRFDEAASPHGWPEFPAQRG